MKDWNLNLLPKQMTDSFSNLLRFKISLKHIHRSHTTMYTIYYWLLYFVSW